MENTLENKAKFFGQYFGVHCLRHSDLQNISALPVMTPWNPGLHDEYLELTPLSQISDEDFIEIYKIKYPSNRTIGVEKLSMKEHKHEKYFDFQLKWENGGIWSTGPISAFVNINSVDTLRSKGYALPYLDLSVEDLIDYGWVRLKEEGDSN